ncbi:tctex1 domain-containing protein 3 [Oncorhynchus kisutch]|uniref:Tctex1 domain-containing protein 3 n=1 Tax=Oncorhynchus kisutch TaxID=8019 RepID=A0A8C7MK15_ONCKI|nr:tctex1 domain-containing protein 3 [Oncorhynchus kisutch]
MSERRGSIMKGIRKDSHTDRLRGSTMDIEMNDDDDSHPVKRGSSVWKSGFKGKLANTYRLGPKQKFLPHLIQKKGEELMNQAFGELAYDHDNCRDVADKVAADVLAFCKEQVFDRYRYVARVVVGEKKGQTVKIASRTLWDDEKDNFLTLNFENRHLFAVGMVFAIYFE